MRGGEAKRCTSLRSLQTNTIEKKKKKEKNQGNSFESKLELRRVSNRSVPSPAYRHDHFSRAFRNPFRCTLKGRNHHHHHHHHVRVVHCRTKASSIFLRPLLILCLQISRVRPPSFPSSHRTLHQLLYLLLKWLYWRLPYLTRPAQVNFFLPIEFLMTSTRARSLMWYAFPTSISYRLEER